MCLEYLLLLIPPVLSYSTLLMSRLSSALRISCSHYRSSSFGFMVGVAVFAVAAVPIPAREDNLKVRID